MKRPVTVIIAAAASFLLTSAAFADYFARDGQGQLFTLASKIINGVHYQVHLMAGAPGNVPPLVAMDGSGNLGVNVVSTAAPAYGASGIMPVTGPLNTTGQSAAFTPIYGRPENIAFSGTGIFTIQFERKFAGDTTWYPIGSLSGQRFTWSTAGSQTVTVSDFFTETEVGATNRWDVTACSGCALTYRISQ